MVISGIRISMRLKERAALLEKTLLFINSMKLDFEYSALSLDLIIQKYAFDELYFPMRFLKICYEEMQNGTDFPIAWKNSLMCPSLYNEEEKSKLLALGEILGTSNCQAQMNILNFYTVYFENFNIKAKKNSEKYGETSILTGIFLGIGLFVLLI